jgi:SOS response associated peptidase (SRAP)
MVEVRPITDCGLPGCGAAVNWLPEPDDPSPNLVRGPGRRPKRSWFRGHIGAPCCVQARREVNMPMRRATGNCPATSYICCMCGRVIQSGGPLRYAIVDGMNVRDSRMHNYLPRWNAAPSQELLVIRRNHRTSEVSIDPLRWGLIPNWCKDPSGGRKPSARRCAICPRSATPTGCAAASCRSTASSNGRRLRANGRNSPMPLP